MSSGICPLAEVLNGTAGPHCVVHDNRSATPPAPAYAALIFDRRGNLWMRSWEGGGIKRLDAAAFRDAFRPGHPEGRVESFTKRDGLTSDAVRSIFQDRRDGSIWVGTDHGLDHFREPSFLSALPNPGVADFGIQAQKDGRVWIWGRCGRRIVDRLSGGKDREDCPSWNGSSGDSVGAAADWDLSSFRNQVGAVGA